MNELHKNASEFMTNILREREAIALQAARESGFELMYVHDDATDKNGRPVSDCVALYTPYKQLDHTPFWDRYDELKAEATT